MRHLILPTALCLLTACAPAKTNIAADVTADAVTDAVAPAVPVSKMRLHLDKNASQGQFDLLMLSKGPPVALDLGSFYSKPCLRIHAGTLAKLQPDPKGVVDARLNELGALVITPKATGVTTLQARLTITKNEVMDKAPPAPPECDAFFNTKPTVDLTIKVNVAARDRVVFTSKSDARNVTMYALPGATASLSYKVHSATGEDLTFANNRAAPSEVLWPDLTEDAFTFPAPALGEERVIKTTLGDSVTVRTIDPSDLKAVEILYGRKTTPSKMPFGFLEDKTSWAGTQTIQVHVTALSTADAPVNFISIDKIASVTSQTPAVCVATQETPKKMNSGFWAGNITPKGAGECTFTVTVGGASKTTTFTLSP